MALTRVSRNFLAVASAVVSARDGELDAGVDQPLARAILAGRVVIKMKVGGHQSGNHGSVAQVHKASLGTRQSSHLGVAPQSHDFLAFDGHGFNNISGSVGNIAAIIHGDNFPVGQNDVGIPLLGN